MYYFNSERRKIFGETDADFAQMMKLVLDGGLIPILCIGETKEEYELGIYYIYDIYYFIVKYNNIIKINMNTPYKNTHNDINIMI